MFRLTNQVLGLTKADLKAAERSHKVAEMSKYFSKFVTNTYTIEIFKVQNEPFEWYLEYTDDWIQTYNHKNILKHSKYGSIFINSVMIDKSKN